MAQRKAIWTALGLSESAPVDDARTAFNKLLSDEMTPDEKRKWQEEQDALKAEKDKEASELKALKDKQARDEKELGEVKTAMGLKADATPAVMLATIKTLAGDRNLSEAVLQDRGAVAQLNETVRVLSEKVDKLEPQAKLAESLQADAKKKEKQHFFDEMVRTGKCLPAEREFQESMYDLDADKVRKHLSERKAQVNLGNGGGSEHKPAPAADPSADPSAQLAELANARMREKNLSYPEAMDQVRAENTELSEAAAAQYRP